MRPLDLFAATPPAASRAAPAFAQHRCGPAAPEDVGGSVATFLKPDALDSFYGDNPMGYTVFAKLTLGR